MNAASVLTYLTDRFGETIALGMLCRASQPLGIASRGNVSVYGPSWNTDHVYVILD